MALYYRAVGPDRFRYREIILFSGKHIYLDRKPFTEYERKVDENAGKVITDSLLTTVFVIFSFFLVIIGPAYVFVVHGEYVVPTGVILPFVDPNTGRGYAINIIIQFGTAIAALLGLVSIEGMSSMINNAYTVMADILCFNMRKFSDDLGHGTFSNENRAELRNIFVQLQDLEVYLDELNQIYYWKFFLQPMLTTICVALAIFAQLHVSNGWAFMKKFSIYE